MAQQTDAATNEPKPKTDADGYLEVHVDHLHELADVERLLRTNDFQNVHVNVAGAAGAHISFATDPCDEHYRGSQKAALARELAATSAWDLSSIHDDFEDPENEEIESMVHVFYNPWERDE